MINWFHIANFKSLVDFKIPEFAFPLSLPPEFQLNGFSCLIGLNGAGKTTILQAFDLISHIIIGDVRSWIEMREWKPADLSSHFGKRTPIIEMEVGMTLADGKKAKWEARFNSVLLKCTSETIMLEMDMPIGHPEVLIQKSILRLKDGRLNVNKDATNASTDSSRVSFEYDGSVLSTLKLSEFHPALSEVKENLSNLCSLELLSPDKLRRKSRTAVDMGPGGERLASYLDQLSTGAREELLEKLREFYPGLSQWRVAKGKYGWRNLSIQESYPGSGAVDAAHINDGFLRVIAILSQAYGSHRFLLFDEIENGVHPSLVEKLMDFLVQLGRQGKQVVVTTHSPMVLNYLDDDVARAGVHLVYKTAEGFTRTCRYFEQEETRDKLGMLGPGEVFADTDLTSMVKRLSSTVAAPVEKDKD